MRHHRVHDIIRPYRKDVAVWPCVALDDRVMHAIELMVAGGLQEIAVVHHDRPVGLVMLAEAFRRLGLDPPETRTAGRRAS
jgi:CBS domain-containing protein